MLGTMSLFAAGARALTDPASLALTAFYRDYTNPAWGGTASAGTSGSGSNDLTDPGNEPAQGTALNSHGTADFNGTDDFLLAEGTLDTYSAATALSGWILCNPDTVASTRYLVSSYNGGLHLEVWTDASGNASIRLNALSDVAIRTIAASAYSLITFRYDGANIQIGVNEAPGASDGNSVKAYSSNITLTGTVRVGANYNGLATLDYFDGHVAEIGLTDTLIIDNTFADIKAYINARYALAL